MAEISKYVFDILRIDNNVSAIVSNRIYPVFMPQNVTFPAVVYAISGGNKIVSIDGDSGVNHALVQTDCFAESYSVCRDLASKVDAALCGASNIKVVPSSPVDWFDEDVEKFRITQEFSIWE